ncbi:uncharacterized protein LOC125549139 isoform X2 [Triticum urartu]|uniref:uncharacterized protein LOC125549139 isoform X2 n=1 Tax=Triticum urartu TaxID=4572 RepID=UPI002042FB4E|nr:uncharacterized protein LOC125549139 isoform X2 [Triticum urartu]
MDGDRRSPAAAAAASAASVLGDDDLLREILLRLGFPTCLVRAALVCKRWLLHASDPAFLRRFRERNPPRLLGFCLRGLDGYSFVPLPQPPELAVPIHRATSSCAAAFANNIHLIKHCRNGRLITESFHNKATTRRHALLAPLLAGESATFPPPNPPHSRDWDGRAQVRFIEVFLPEDGGLDGITLVHLWNVGRKIYAEVCVLGSDGWGVPASAEMELPAHMELAAQRYDERFLADMLPPVLGKVFMVTTSGGFTLGLDLATASFFTLELPDGVQNNYKLSCAENSGLYLVGADGFQLSVWLHPMIGDDDGAGNWRLVDTFCVHETCTRHVGHYREQGG